MSVVDEIHLDKDIDIITLSYAFSDFPIWKMREIWESMSNPQRFAFSNLLELDNPSFREVSDKMKYIQKDDSGSFDLIELLQYMKRNETIDFDPSKVFTDRHTDVFVEAQSIPLATALVYVQSYIMFESKRKSIERFTSEIRGDDLEELSESLSREEPVKISHNPPMFRIHSFDSIIRSLERLYGRDKKERVRSPSESPPKFSKEECEKWRLNPLVHPKTGRHIRLGSLPYQNLERSCSE